MKFNRHSGLEGAHALLSPSTYHWIRYDDDQLIDKVRKSQASRLGSQLHEFASMAIKLNRKLPATKDALNRFVNEVLGFRMESEQLLFYSPNCFGTADAIGLKKFRGNDLPTLQIFDLKTGEGKCSVDQLLVYAALFCLEYNFKAFELLYDLRIYQGTEPIEFDTDPADVAQIMATITHFDQLIEKYNAELSV